MTKAKGRTASGRIKKGYKLSKGGSVVKAKKTTKRRNYMGKRRAS